MGDIPVLSGHPLKWDAQTEDNSLSPYAIAYTKVEHVKQTALRKQSSFFGQQLFGGVGGMFSSYKNVMYCCWRYLKQSNVGGLKHTSHLSVSWDPSLGAITESWCIPPRVGIKDKNN